MPIYEYICNKCNHNVEMLVRTGEKPVCPDCGSKKLTRRLSVPAAPRTGAKAVCPAHAAGDCSPHSGGCGCGAGCCCGHHN